MALPRRGKHGPRCTREVRVETFAHHDTLGTNRLTLGGKRLKAGSYELEATPSSLGQTGAMVHVGFRVT